MHVYHYAPYEPTALKRLMGRYGTREDEVDRLLREGVLVDLLRAVRQSLRASVESYSIKKMEAFYGFEREIDLRDAGSSIVAFEQWLELGEGERPRSDILERIERYNRDDVVSNQRLRDWLEARRDRAGRRPASTSRGPRPHENPLPPELTEQQARVQALADRLTDPAVIPTDPLERTAEQHAQWLLAQLLGWHRREDKAMWWEFHRLMDLTPEAARRRERARRPARAHRAAGRREPKNGKQTWRYRFPPQDLDLGRRRRLYDPARQAGATRTPRPSTGVSATLVAVDLGERRPSTSSGSVERSASARASCRSPGSGPRTIRRGCSSSARWVAEHGIDGTGPGARGPRPAAGARRHAPAGGRRAPIAEPGETDLEAARRSALLARRDSPGDPGSARLRQDLHRRPDDLTLLAPGRTGRHHGDQPQGHRQPAATPSSRPPTRRASPFDAIQRGDADVIVVDDPRGARGKDAKDVATRSTNGSANLAAGTSWLWASANG